MTLPAPHRDDSPSDLELLTARGWSAIPWDYNALISLVFESSGLGRLTLGYGQFIYGLVNFRFAVHDNNTLLIEYERTPGVAYIPDFVPDPAHAYKNVQYSLVPNHGSGATDSLLRYEGNAVLHPFAWDFRLTLNDSPFPYNLPEPDFRPPSAPTRKVPCASITAACRWRPLHQSCRRDRITTGVRELQSECPHKGRALNWLRRRFTHRGAACAVVLRPVHPRKDGPWFLIVEISATRGGQVIASVLPLSARSVPAADTASGETSRSAPRILLPPRPSR